MTINSNSCKTIGFTIRVSIMMVMAIILLL